MFMVTPTRRRDPWAAVTRQPFECIIKPPVAPIVPVILPGNTMDGAYVGLLGS
jgi:hypothetical protein